MSRINPNRTGPFRPGIAEAEVESLNYDGLGVAHVNGKATFIEGALPGEHVRFRVLNRGKSYDTGLTIEVLRESPDRVKPACQYFGVCGGCSLQHLRSDAQIPAKQQVLSETLERIGKASPEVWLPPLTGPQWHYRRKARLGVRLVDKKGGVIIGFREKRRSYLAPLASCEVLHESVSRLLPAMRELIGKLSVPNRIPQVEVAVGGSASNEAAGVVTLVIRHLVPLNDADDTHLAEFARTHGVRIFRQPGRPDQLVPVWPKKPDALLYRLPEYDVDLEFAPADFVQVNAEINRKMIAQAVSLLDPGPSDRVLDLFCGLGNFTLPLARRAASVVGIEADVAMVEKARQNAFRNQLDRVEFHTADLYDPAAATPWGEAAYNKWLLDPPRNGAIEVLKRLPQEGGPERILYVSCNPGTLARDTELLVRVKGYRLMAAGVLDMFPQTS
ncbi:MAG: 23S rRNA (uracil(1939)-C(5))-methyltransferase RlmD, partial [Gammaproteobacteria bacterium]|nr:23S rRNA (uracil(1939)-C(5))-methyltransferase RlmD [Gammaproteobacteria bacterium]